MAAALTGPSRHARRLAPLWPGMAVAAAYLASVALMPQVDVPVGDDWFYARTVELLVEGRGFRILDATVVTLILPALWGALFAAVFGMSFMALRWSAVTLVAAGGVAVYALCRTLGASRRWSAVGAAAVLFNPLSYVLSNSFMSDAPFTAALTVSALLYVKGLAQGEERRSHVIAGSVAAAAAFLVRQQGALIPIAVAAHLLVTRRVAFDRRGLGLLVRVAGVPAATGAVYVLWLRFVHGIPSAQHLFNEEVGFLFRRAMVGHAARLLVTCLVYGGLFVAPVALAALLRPRRLMTTTSARGWAVFALAGGTVVVGALVFADEQRLMPYVPQYLAEWGLGPADLMGGRPLLVGRRFMGALTVVSAGAAVVALLALARARFPRPGAGGPGERRSRGTGRPGARGAGLIVAILAWQAIGIVPPSLHFQNPVPSAILVITLDRYLLPLLPLAVCLAVWAVADLRAPSWPAWVVTGGLGVIAVAGSHDFLRFQKTVWDVAEEARSAGVPIQHLDGGAQWDVAHMHVDGVPVPVSRHDRPWWINRFAWDIDPRWVVSTVPLDGYDLVDRTTYDTWLPVRGEKHVLLLRRGDTAAVIEPAPMAEPLNADPTQSS